MRRTTVLLLFCAIIGSLASGCYSPKPIPKAYFEGKTQMSVAVGKCPDKAQMSDSGQGGLIGAMVTAGRAGPMHEAMSGIAGDTVKELIRQRFSEKMEEYFDVYEEGPLKTVIDIQQWGWYVPTTVAGIKTGSYQFIINGTVTVTDNAQKRKPRIADLRMQVSETIGNKPTAAVSQEALLKCADKFAAQTVTFLVKEQTAKPKSK
jgi:hypothetical protein